VDHQREEARMNINQGATATILGHPDVTVGCRITNFSRTGMCIQVGQNIPHGHPVKVDWDRNFLVGRVQRVAVEGGEYSVGLQLLYCSQWQDQSQLATQ
jgi:hypothetical protein